MGARYNKKNQKWIIPKTKGLTADEVKEMEGALQTTTKPFIRSLSALFQQYPLCAHTVQVGRGKKSKEEQRFTVHPVLRRLCAHLSTCYPAVGLLPSRHVQVIRDLLSAKQWSSAADVLRMSKDAAVLKDLISAALTTNGGRLPEYMSVFLRELLNHVVSFDRVPTPPAEEVEPDREQPSTRATGFHYPYAVRRRLKSKYKIDSGNKSDAACSKYANHSSKFMPGVMLVLL